MRFDRVAHIVCLGTAFIVFTGCQGMHLHDPGRLKAASEATELAKEFSSDGGAIFTPMEENLDSFTSIEQEIVDLANAHELETFTAIVASQTADELGAELLDMMTEWSDNVTLFDEAERAAVQAVNKALDRQNVVAAVLTEKEKSDAGGTIDQSLQGALDRLKNRLDTMDKNAKLFLKAFDQAAKLSGDDSSEAEGESDLNALTEDQAKLAENVEKVREWTGIAQNTLDEVGKDEQMVAARALLAATIQEQLASEANRIAEYRRYLGEIRRLRQTFDTREVVAVCRVFLPAYRRLFSGVTDETTIDELVTIFKNFKNNKNKRYQIQDSDEASTEDDLKEEVRCEFGVVKANPQVKADWRSGKNTLAEYLAANVKRKGRDASGPRLVAALGILGFVERPFLDNAVNKLYLEANRHSLRLSKINAQQRADLLRDLASSIEIYELGGIKPEEVARLALFASQVGALFYIGAQQ